MAALSGLSCKKRGTGLVELTIAGAVIGTLGTFALPSYADSVQRSRVLEALVELSSFSMRMEAIYHDTGKYGAESCAAAVPRTRHFAFDCALSNGGQNFKATATGQAKLAGYVYSIDEKTNHRTDAHPRGAAPATCWSLGGSTCE